MGKSNVIVVEREGESGCNMQADSDKLEVKNHWIREANVKMKLKIKLWKGEKSNGCNESSS